MKINPNECNKYSEKNERQRESEIILKIKNKNKWENETKKHTKLCTIYKFRDAHIQNEPGDRQGKREREKTPNENPFFWWEFECACIMVIGNDIEHETNDCSTFGNFSIEIYLKYSFV